LLSVRQDLSCNSSPRGRGRLSVARLARWQMLIESPGNSMPMIPSAIAFCFMRGARRPSPLAAVFGGVGGGVGERDGGRELRERLEAGKSHKEPSGPRESAREWRVAGCSLLSFSAVVLCCCSLLFFSAVVLCCRCLLLFSAVVVSAVVLCCRCLLLFSAVVVSAVDYKLGSQIPVDSSGCS
jgi:hypothetical protein